MYFNIQTHFIGHAQKWKITACVCACVCVCVCVCIGETESERERKKIHHHLCVCVRMDCVRASEIHMERYMHPQHTTVETQFVHRRNSSACPTLPPSRSLSVSHLLPPQQCGKELGVCEHEASKVMQSMRSVLRICVCVHVYSNQNIRVCTVTQQRAGCGWGQGD